MQRVDDSWLIMSEVIMEPQEWDDNYQPEASIKVLALPSADPLQERIQERPVNNSVRWDLQWAGQSLPLEHYVSSAHYSDFLKILELFQIEAYTQAGYEDVTDVYGLLRGTNQLMLDLPIPRFGSPPKDFGRLRDAIYAGGPGTAGIVNGLGPHPSLIFMFSGVGLSLIITMVLPAAKGIGRGLERNLESTVDSWFNTPPKKAPAKKTAAKKVPAKKTAAKKVPAKKVPAKKTAAKKTTGRDLGGA